MKTGLKTILGTLSCILFLNAPEFVLAENSVDQPPNAAQLDEIVVTAQKRSENAQTVPISISVLTASSLQDVGVSNVSHLTQAVPGLVLDNVSGIAQPFIRGVGSSSTSEFSGSAISVYLDGVYLPSLGQMFRELDDIERIEVLKGPQGVLYGRNSPGGAINIITQDPTPDTQARFGVTIGNFSEQKYTMFVSGGTDELMGSLSAFSARHDPYVKNLAAQGPGIDPGLNDQDVQGARAKLKYKPNDSWSFLLEGDYSYTHDHDGFGYTNYGVKPTGAFTGGNYSFGPYTTYLNAPGFNILNEGGGSLTVRGNLPDVDFVSISSYRKYAKEYATDLDGTDLATADTVAQYASETTTQEFQVLSNGSSPFQWIAGTFFMHQIQVDPVQLFIPPTPEISIQGNDSINSIAAFAQLSYALTDSWKVSAGARYTRDKANLTESNESVGGAVVLSNPLQNKTWTNTSPKVDIEYHQPGLLLYASATQGYRNGIYNLASPGDPGPVDPEKITAYEIGGKHQVFNDVLRINWAAYLYNYKDLQVDVVDLGSGTTKTENAAASKSYGVDLDLTAAVTTRLTASLGLAYLHATYTDFPNASVSVPNYVSGGTTGLVANITGSTVTRSPQSSASAQLQYAQPIPNGELLFTGSYSFSSGYYLDINDSIRQPAYGLTNLRAQFNSADKHWTTAVFCENCTNTTFLAGEVQIAYAQYAQYGNPRLYGVSLAYKY